MPNTQNDPSPFPGLDSEIERIRQGHFTDRYFNLARDLLGALDAERISFGGASKTLVRQGLTELEIATAEPGALEVEMQYFARRQPRCLLCGIRPALYILRHAAGVFDGQEGFHSTYQDIETHAVPEGAFIQPFAPALRLRGRYRDFAHLETIILGILARATRVATNTYELLEAADGKPVFFFPGRYDLFQAQNLDGYAYKTAIDRYNAEYGRQVQPFVSTDAQAEWWGASGAGSLSHSYLLCFLRDTAEAMLAFARLAPPEAKRIALVDVNNDCIGDSLAVAKIMFVRYRELTEAGSLEQAQRYKLFGVRCDTAAGMRDKSVEPLGDPRLDCGVAPRLVFELRRALNETPARLDLPIAWQNRAREYFRDIKIIASGGFVPSRIRDFEHMGVPVDSYGIGSAFFAGPDTHFTADIVRVKVAEQWCAMGKEGRCAIPSSDLKPVTFDSPPAEPEENA